eukprot:m.12381 g.12381  ORF g.12381 m.12381 type:complete len:660 (+) comp6296_c0_seq1:54-2033(+)
MMLQHQQQQRKRKPLLLLMVLVLAQIAAAAAATDVHDEHRQLHLLPRELFHEQLRVQPQRDSSVLVELQHRLVRPASAKDGQYDVFPQSIDAIVAAHQVEELHLAFTRGRAAVLSSLPPPGLVLWACLRPQNSNMSFIPQDQQLQRQFGSLRRALAPLVGAALGHTSLSISLPSARCSSDSSAFLMAVASDETVCPTSLALWNSLLPVQRGYSSLLDARFLMEQRYLSASIHIRRGAGQSQQTELILSTQFLTDVSGTFSLSSLFQRFTPLFQLKDDSDVVDSRRLILDLQRNCSEGVSVAWQPADVRSARAQSEIRLDLDRFNGSLDVQLVLPSRCPQQEQQQHEYATSTTRDSVSRKFHDDELAQTSLVRASRRMDGTGLQRAVHRTVIDNASTRRIAARLLLVVPWEFQVLTHTLLQRSESLASAPNVTTQNDSNSSVPAIKTVLLLRPASVDEAEHGKGRSQHDPLVWEVAVQLAAETRLQLTFEVGLRLLQVHEYSPVPHGMRDLGPAVFSWRFADDDSDNNDNGGNLGQDRDRSCVAGSSKCWRRDGKQPGNDGGSWYKTPGSANVSAIESATDLLWQWMSRSEGDSDSSTSTSSTSTSSCNRRTHALFLNAVGRYMPTPDFSMSYNAVMITCMVLGIAFGSWMRVLHRPWLD